MRKALVTIALGEKYRHMEQLTCASRKRYAEKHGFEYLVYDELPQGFLRDRSELSPRELAYRFKLFLPTLQSDYDFVAFIDGDTFVNADAPSLELYESRIPSAGFAACTSYSYEERHRYWPDWSRTYYEGLAKMFGLELPTLWDEQIDINSGLLLYRPQEIAERWRGYSEMATPLNEENILNLYDVQNGLCYLMDDNWNRIWYYQKYRLGFLKPATSQPVRYRNAAANRMLSGVEKSLLAKELNRCHMMHFAYEHHKTLWSVIAS